MNILERNNLINAHKQLSLIQSIGKCNNNIEEVYLEETEENYLSFWNNMNRPPIDYYIPNQIIAQLRTIIMDKKLKNKSSERMNLINDTLRPFGIKSLGLGTNRKVFYHEQDPNIVFKVGLDSIGRTDNLSEFRLQHLIKPLCSKMFHTLDDGLISMSERGEVMSEKDYKITWAHTIFKIIITLFSYGYIMEDVGSNFYKNWAIRLGFGPILIDYPYIYRVNLNDLKCFYVNPNTKEICGGDIRYNISKGLSELYCCKCGRRHIASQLALKFPIENIVPIIRGGSYRNSRKVFNDNIKVSRITDDNDIIRFMNENDEVLLEKDCDEEKSFGTWEEVLEYQQKRAEMQKKSIESRIIKKEVINND